MRLAEDVWQHLREKRKVKEELNKYIEESIAKDFGR